MVDLGTDLQQGLPPVYCVIDEINQVVLNMIINSAHAVKDAAEKGIISRGKVTIKTRSQENCVHIVISDNGTGIPADNIDKIFAPFFTTKDLGKGTGQGLAIAHDIVVNKHGGSILIESEQGRGATFTIVLPLVGPETGPEGDV